MNQIIKRKIAISGTLLLLATTSVLAEDTVGGDRTMKYDRSDLYHANELSFDAFASGSIGRYTIEHFSGQRVRHSGRVGAGIGLNYFFTRYFGLGIDAYSENTTGIFIDTASANLIFRIPIGNTPFAPYLFAGGGHNFDTVRTSFGQAGAGFEYRFSHHLGAFIDGRAVAPDRTKYYGLARAGFRVAF
jgi:hypothetical protein